ncbi:MAG: methyltransferase domain protein [Phenylobacterium sp.]|nr:methyltransferase domain protein [Phenylobacterium sp.]
MIPADETLRSLLKRHLDDHDLIANLGSFGRRMHAMKAFAHYEVFKLVQDLPGDIVECGVYKGSSLLSFARFLETFCPGDRTRRVLGFDHFKGLADRSEKDGLNERVGNTAEGWNPAQFRDTLFALVDASMRTASCRSGHGSSWSTATCARPRRPMSPSIRACASPCCTSTWTSTSRPWRR